MLEYFSHYKGKDIASIVNSQTTELKVDLVRWTVEFNWIFLFSKSELSSNLSKKKKKSTQGHSEMAYQVPVGYLKLLIHCTIIRLSHSFNYEEMSTG